MCPSPLCPDPQSPCSLSDQVFVCTSSQTLSSVISVSLSNVSLYCYYKTENYPDCSFNITAASVNISNSLIYASLIDIRGEDNVMISESVLTTNGTGNMKGEGLCLNKGNSYGGRGGGNCRPTCGEVCYGDFKAPYSYGTGSSMVSRGGGIIAIRAPQMVIGGEISSAGDLNLTNPYVNPTNLPYPNTTPGASGGSVLINATDIDVFEGESVVITVAGGLGGSDSYSGGGGRVAIYGSVPRLTVITMGQLSPDGYRMCPSGGSGTYYSDISKTIYVNNRGVRTENQTPLSTDGTLSLRITNGATVSPFYIEEVLNATSISLESGSIDIAWDQRSENSLESFQLLISSPSIELAYSAMIGSSDARNISITSEMISIDLSSGIEFGGSLEIRTSNLMLQGEIEGYLKAEYPTVVTIYAESCQMLSEAIVKANWIGVAVSKDFFFQGTMQTPGSACITSSQSPLQSCVVSESAPLPDLTPLLGSNFTLYVYSSESITLSQNAKTFGSRIGFCSSKLSIAGTVSALGYGCLGNEGAGKGSALVDRCAATGGGYGGAGGIGAVINTTANCSHTLPGQAYGDSEQPWLEGSGGGGVVSTPGSGGGLIVLQAEKQVNISGTVTASGEDAPPSSAVEGAGGGSGGSVFIQTHSLSGSGTVTASGGSGIGPGGGGGGGRILLNWIIGSLPSEPSVAEQWSGSILAIGGSALNLTGKGGSGTINSAACPPGYEGVLCTPCAVGYYKPGSEFKEMCARCKNKPKIAHYQEVAGTSKDCPYKCPEWFLNQSDNTECESPIFEFFGLFGGTWPGVGVLSSSVFVISVLITIIFTIKLTKRRKSLMHHLLKPMLLRSPTILHERKMPLPKSEQPETTREALPFHLHRIYFLGDNTYSRPWGLPMKPTPQLEPDVQPQEFANFAQRVNSKVRWHFWEHFILRLLQVIYPPLELIWLTFRRRRKYEKLRLFVQRYSESLWKKVDLQQLSDSLRVSCTCDYTVAAVDVICPTRRVEEWDERPHLPMQVLASGYGTYDFPFHFHVKDLMMEYLSWTVGFDKRNDFYRFLVKLNALARQLRNEKPLIEQEEFIQIENLVDAFNGKCFAGYDYKFIPCIFQSMLYITRGNHNPPNDDSSKQFPDSEPNIVISCKLGLILAETKTPQPLQMRMEGYWEPMALNASSESLLANNGIPPCRKVIYMKKRKCSLNAFLQGSPKPCWVFWMSALSLFACCDLVMFGILMTELCSTGDLTGILIYSLIVPGAAAVAPIITILSMSHAKTIRYSIKFQIASLYSAVAAVVYTSKWLHYSSWAIVMAADFVVKIGIIKLAAIHTASLSRLRPWRSKREMDESIVFPEPPTSPF